MDNMLNHKFFKSIGPVSLEAVAQKIGAKLKGNSGNIEIIGVGTIESAKQGEIAFLTNAKYSKHLLTTNASACIVDEAAAQFTPNNLALLVHPNPHEAYALLVDFLYPDEKVTPVISEKASLAKTAKIGKNVSVADFAVIGEGVTIGDDCRIGPNCYIGDNVEIGESTEIQSNCTITFTKIGNNVIIKPGARIGQDGFGFAKTSKGLIKVKQLGMVIIGNHVEIGANTCIDRGAIEDTIIGDGSKIDNAVQIGHNTIIGKSCIVCGQVGLAGSTKVEDFVMLGGQVGVAGHLNIGAGSMIAAGSGIMSDVPAKSIMGGSPATTIRDWHKTNAMLRRLIKRDKVGKNE
jgi:UDP-3-O-[3-hydroxymyristoyl] glucosamine N-acyltransferase